MNFIKPLMTAGLPLIKNVLTPSAKVVLIPLRLSAGMPTGDAAIKKIFDELGNNFKWKNEMEDLIKIA